MAKYRRTLRTIVLGFMMTVVCTITIIKAFDERNEYLWTAVLYIVFAVFFVVITITLSISGCAVYQQFGMSLAHLMRKSTNRQYEANYAAARRRIRSVLVMSVVFLMFSLSVAVILVYQSAEIFLTWACSAPWPRTLLTLFFSSLWHFSECS